MLVTVMKISRLNQTFLRLVLLQRHENTNFFMLFPYYAALHKYDNNLIQISDLLEIYLFFATLTNICNMEIETLTMQINLIRRILRHFLMLFQH